MNVRPGWAQALFLAALYVAAFIVPISDNVRGSSAAPFAIAASLAVAAAGGYWLTRP